MLMKIFFSRFAMRIRKFVVESHLKINILDDAVYISYSVMWFETLVLRKLCHTNEFSVD